MVNDDLSLRKTDGIPAATSNKSAGRKASRQSRTIYSPEKILSSAFHSFPSDFAPGTGPPLPPRLGTAADLAGPTIRITGAREHSNHRSL